MIAILLSLFAYISVSAFAANAPDSNTHAILTTKGDDSIPVYAYPDATSDIIGKYRIGTSVTAIANSGESWVHIDTGDKMGYVHAMHISIVEGEDVRMGIVAIAGSELNVRSEESLDSAIVGRVANGDAVKILASSGDWHFIEIDGVKGFVLSKHILVQ